VKDRRVFLDAFVLHDFDIPTQCQSKSYHNNNILGKALAWTLP
jgi:hypothetical protein